MEGGHLVLSLTLHVKLCRFNHHGSTLRISATNRMFSKQKSLTKFWLRMQRLSSSKQSLFVLIVEVVMPLLPICK